LIAPVLAASKAFFAESLGLKVTIVAAEPTGDGWIVTAETILEDPHMRALAHNDLVATYEIRMNQEHEVLSFTRKAMRERGSITT
jgi:hypothetical protein